MDIDIEQIQSIISDKDLSKFIGTKENFYFEAKNRNPYDLSNPNGRYELVKDVTAFANSQGGFLIIGLNTEQLIEENTDCISTLDLSDYKDFNINSYEGVIKDFVYPSIKNLKIGFVIDKQSTEKGVGYIFVPPQNEFNKYFLIKNLIEDGEKLKNIVFGIIKRNGADNIPLNIAEIYNYLQNGKNSIATRLTSIEEKIDLLSVTSHKKSSLIKFSAYNDEAKIEEILKVANPKE